MINNFKLFIDVEQRHPSGSRKSQTNQSTHSSMTSQMLTTSNSSPQQIRSQPKVLKIATAGHIIKWVSGKKLVNQIIDQIKSQKSLTWHEIMGDRIINEHNLQFAINFNDDLMSCIKGAELLDSLKYELPEKVKMLATRKERLQKDVAAVKAMLKSYNSIMKELSIPQMNLLRNEIKHVELFIQQGLSRINWTSLGIVEYADICLTKINYFTNLYQRISHIENELHVKIKQLSNFNLFDYRTVEEEPTRLACKDFFTDMDDTRIKKVCEMSKVYESFGPILIKIETLVLGTNTGRSSAMAASYIYWETEIYKAFISFAIRNFETFTEKMQLKKPMFQVDAVVIAPELFLRPTSTEIYNIMVKSVKHFLDILKRFPRWMNGMCLICESQKLQTGEVHIYTFYEDVLRVPDIHDVLHKLQDITQKSIVEVQRHMQKWRRYRNLWSFDKTLTCEKFIEKNNQLEKYDEKFIFYSDILKDMEQHTDHIDIGCIRLNLRPLLETISGHTLEWKNRLGELLDKATKNKMNEMNKMMDELKIIMNQNIKGLQKFKKIMEAISTILKNNVNIELDYLNCQDTYAVLEQHHIDFDPLDKEMAYTLEKKWKALHFSALYREQKLELTKDRFAQMTLTEIENFCKILAAFVKKFDEEGPGAVGEHLDMGVLLMEEYSKQFEELETQRQDLLQAEMLFDIPLADYSEYLRIKTDFEAMAIVFKFYKTQKHAREVWGRTLWANLDPQALSDGIDDFIKEYRRVSKQIRALTVGQMLDLQMKQFKNVIPLMVALKNEALRERHWQDLMQKTGIEFDMSPDRFTLDNMFAMELHRYQDIAETIINHAIKELAIEKGVKQIAEVWNNMNFILHKHLKGVEDRGYIVGSTDEIMQSLEDNSMNLQSMAASQFVGPFLGQVQKLERSLANIGEVCSFNYYY